MNTLETLQDILVNDFDLKLEQLASNAELTRLGVDSLDVLELMFKIEDRFSVKIKDDIPTSLVTLNDVVLYIDTLLVQLPETRGSAVSHVTRAQ